MWKVEKEREKARNFFFTASGNIDWILFYLYFLTERSGNTFLRQTLDASAGREQMLAGGCREAGVVGGKILMCHLVSEKKREHRFLVFVLLAFLRSWGSDDQTR